MDSSRNPDATSETSDDLSALAWVHEELRRSLDAAHKALRRFIKETEALSGSDVDAVDPAVLRTARQQVHQGVGALELVGLPAAAAVLRACEAAVQRFVAKPHKLSATVVDDIEHASFALLDYVSRLLAGKTVSALAMFPQYRAVQEAAGADRVHPADLWSVDWQWRDIPDSDTHALVRLPDPATRQALEQQMLATMRAPTRATASRMSEICEGLALGARQAQAATLWRLAAAMFEAQAHGLVHIDVFTKRVAARLLAQLRIVERGDTEVSERLAQDLLFFCAQAAPMGDARKTPRLAAVRHAYALAGHTPVDYSVSALGRFDPAVIAQARKRVSAAKESWSAVAGGEMHRMSGLAEQFALVGDSLKRLFPSGDAMAAELAQAVALTQQGGTPPSAPLAMEVATSLLYLEASLEDAEFDNPEQGGRVRRLVDRISAVRLGGAPAPLEGWMEELYRRVSDRQTMGSVVQELRASLSEAEKLIDQFFRNPTDRNVLIPVPNQLATMRGVLSVLGMDQASAALLRMRDEVERLVSGDEDAAHDGQAVAFDRLADNLGALGFLIDMLSVQPQMAKSLFVYDAQQGTLSPVMGRSAQRAPMHTPPPVAAGPRLIEQAQMLAFSAVREDVSLDEVSRDLERLSQEAEAADHTALAATVSQARVAIEQAHGDAEHIASARGHLSEALVDFVTTASDPVGLEPDVAAARAAPVPPPRAPSTGATDLGEDDEMREIFLEEAREVMQTARAACDELAGASDDLEQLTTVRRAFHTLKGSSRMVGLKTFGEAAWACEQLYNARLADQQGADHTLLEFTRSALDELAGWIDDIAAKRDAGRDAKSIETAALALREAPAPAAEPAPSAAPEPAAHPTGLPDSVIVTEAAPEPPVPPAQETIASFTLRLPPDLPTALDLDLAPPAGKAPPTSPPEQGLSFELDLSKFDRPFDGSAAESAVSDQSLGIDVLAPALIEAFDLPATEPIALDSADFAPAASPDDGLIDLDLGDDTFVAAPLIESLQPSADAAPEPPPAVEPTFAEDEQVKVVGPLRISIPLFNIFLNEADELSRRLMTEVAEWAMELHREVGETAIALAHSLAGSSATVGFSDLSHLARLLEHALMRSHAIGHGTFEEGRLFVDSAEEIRRLLHQFAAGFLKEPQADLIHRLADHELSSARRLDALSAAADLSPDEIIVVEEPLAAPEVIEQEPVAQESAPQEIAPQAASADPAPPAQIEVPLTRPAAFHDTATSLAQPGDSDFDAPDSNLAGLGLPELKPFTVRPTEAVRSVAVHDGGPQVDDDIDAIDAVDVELFPIFEEEGQELLPLLASQLRDWSRHPSDVSHASACMRTLHTLKGGARLAGAMRLGEMAHRLESRIEHLLREGEPDAAAIEVLQGRSDALSQTFETLRSRDARAYADAVASVDDAVAEASLPDTAPDAPAQTPAEAVEVAEFAEVDPAAPAPAQVVEAMPAPVAAEPEAPPAAIEPMALPAVALSIAPPIESAPEEISEARALPAEPLVPLTLPEIDWSRFSGRTAAPRQVDRAAASQSAVRVRAPLLDRLVNQAGEVSITRSRIEAEVGTIKGSLSDLTDNLERLRQQLRDIELQAETQMTSRLEAAKALAQSFDPLEFDRFTRFQELTRMMAESVNDVATVQRTLQRTLESTEDELAAQARLTRELQDDLLRTRMVEFEGLSDRLYRVVRQAAKETGKQVRLDIVGGSIEVDRGVLDRMTGAFEHLLRNSVTHGIEAADARIAAAKDPTGSIVVSVAHEGNEVGVEFRDDGAGLNLSRIRDKGVAMGLLDATQQYTDAELANLIFTSGFSTAEKVTELAGRGIGMDVVRSEVNSMGGRIETATAVGQGTSFKLVLPLTTAVTQVVMMRVGAATVAVPSTLVEIVRRATAEEIAHAYESGSFALGDRSVPYFWLGSLLQLSARSAETASRTRQVVIIRSAQQRIAVHVDEVLGNQEVVVKNLGPQLSHMPGLAGMTLLASGSVALIYNPVALATLYGVEARAATVAAMRGPAPAMLQPTAIEVAAQAAPLVLVVDDSLTVRRVTQRLLVREGYRVALAKDGLDALERLAEEKPQMVLSDIEMPRMDGFDLVRNIRGDARLRDLPVIMITSRIAQKHRDYAAELGVDHYLGKPYSEEDLLALIGRYTAHATAS